jgi:hypothetical protein
VPVTSSSPVLDHALFFSVFSLGVGVRFCQIFSCSFLFVCVYLVLAVFSVFVHLRVLFFSAESGRLWWWVEVLRWWVVVLE